MNGRVAVRTPTAANLTIARAKISTSGTTKVELNTKHRKAIKKRQTPSPVTNSTVKVLTAYLLPIATGILSIVPVLEQSTSWTPESTSTYGGRTNTD
ncbi:Ras-interacting protein 1 [Anopheles sinensis]|uniref:Ras-interacting protein 1 n=1 Tax=Anopheles sinensis TaxID=74873 RepID=A0A084VZJ2_ANOSI|nr:Ras-interacting protein 1 [Anopheles sinensis]